MTSYKFFIDDGKEKRGSWTSPGKFIITSNDAGIITVPGRAGKSVSVTTEDALVAPDQSKFMLSIQESIDEFDFNLAKKICPP